MSSQTQRSPHLRAIVIGWGVSAAVLAVSGIVARVLFPSAFLAHGGDSPSIVLRAEEVGRIAGFRVTNTILSCWLATLLVVAVALAARLLARSGHRGLQQAVDEMLEAFLRFIGRLVGQRFAPMLFIVASTTVLFIAANAWIALLPVYGPLTLEDGGGGRVPLLRGAGTDVNMPFALAIVATVVIQVSGIATFGLAYVERFFRVRRLLRGHIVPGIGDLVAGLFELLIEVTRIISFTFRLFGSLTAGEILVLVVTFMAPLALVVPFYGLEIFIGGVQAWIFALLLVMFSAAAMRRDESRPHDD